MSTRDPEYDRFGPWVIRISEEDPPPARFVPYLTRDEPALLSVKIPRKIARRDAHPGMDLYDYVVSLYEHDLVILERIETEVRSETIAYGDIKHVSLREDLLRGTLHLGVPDSPYDLAYNTVSNDVMRPLVDVIVERYRPAGADTVVDLPVPGSLGELSFYLERLLKDEREQGSAMLPLAAQPETGFRSIERGQLRRLLFGIVDKRLLESVHFSDGHQLRIVDRGQPFAYRWQSVYSRRETLIPLANISDVTWLDTGDRTTTTLVVRTGGGDNSWVFTTGNESVEAYRGWLETLAPTRRR